MLRHIAWFNEAPVEPARDGSLTSTDATMCRRCLAPARELEKLGVECSVFGNMHDADPAHVSKHLQKLNCDIVVIGKISGPSLIKLARAAKHLGCYVVADFGNETEISADLVKLGEIADQIVAATPEVAAFVLEKTGASVLVIPDCDEKAKGKNAPDAIAHLWLDSLKKLKLKPPACANTNMPVVTKH
jgi:hypothetical protein